VTGPAAIGRRRADELARTAPRKDWQRLSAGQDSFVGYLTALLLSGPFAACFGPRAPTTVGGVCGVVGSALVAVAPSAGLLMHGG
jgi:hypothetical protein